MTSQCLGRRPHEPEGQAVSRIVGSDRERPRPALRSHQANPRCDVRRQAWNTWRVWYGDKVNVERMDDLTRVTSQLAERNNELIDATAAGDSAEIAALLRDISALERRRNELVRRVAADAAPQRYETAIPVRDRVIQALSLGGRAMAARLLADLARSFYGATIPTQSLSSLRRDERRSFLSAQDDLSRTAERDVYVVPALTFDRFTPVRGTLALSSWPTEHRLIAPS